LKYINVQTLSEVSSRDEEGSYTDGDHDEHLEQPKSGTNVYFNNFIKAPTHQSVNKASNFEYIKD